MIFLYLGKEPVLYLPALHCHGRGRWPSNRRPKRAMMMNAGDGRQNRKRHALLSKMLLNSYVGCIQEVFTHPSHVTSPIVVASSFRKIVEGAFRECTIASLHGGSIGRAFFQSPLIETSTSPSCDEKAFYRAMLHSSPFLMIKRILCAALQAGAAVREGAHATKFQARACIVSPTLEESTS